LSPRLYLFRIYFWCTLFVPIVFYKCEWCNMHYLYCIVYRHWMRLTCLLTGIWVSSGGCLSPIFLLFYGLVPMIGWSICFDNWHILYSGLWTCFSTCNWIYSNKINSKKEEEGAVTYEIRKGASVKWLNEDFGLVHLPYMILRTRRNSYLNFVITALYYILLGCLTDSDFVFWNFMREDFYWQWNCPGPEIWFILGPKLPRKEAQ
jgi:hypothetical protein